MLANGNCVALVEVGGRRLRRYRKMLGGWEIVHPHAQAEKRADVKNQMLLTTNKNTCTQICSLKVIVELSIAAPPSMVTTSYLWLLSIYY